MKHYDYPTGFSHWREAEREAIARVHERGRYTMGEEVAAFEEEFAAFHHRKHAVMVNSGSSANLVAVAALFNKKDKPLRKGCEVLVPAVAWSTTYAPLAQHALLLRVLDCDETWNAPPENRRAELVVSCSILGNPGYLREWQATAASHGAYVIEDNCESFCATTPESFLAGSFGTLSTFSFFWSHQLSAIEGGMILTDDDELGELCRMLRAHGWTRDVRQAKDFEEEYDFRVMGYNVRPLELHAAIAREQLRHAHAFRSRRLRNQMYFQEECAHAGLHMVFPKWRGVPNPFGLHFRVGSDHGLLASAQGARFKLATALRHAGIDCRLPTGGSLRLHAYGAPYRGAWTPIADSIHKTGLFLGNAPYDLDEKIDKAIAVMKEVLLAKEEAA
jgi:CDP-6-deoxy-D-xylo-4-hexulose-3-dehydrase